jgi:hypothetical protein
VIVRSGHAGQRRVFDIRVQAVQAVPELVKQKLDMIKIQTFRIIDIQALEVAI